MYDPILSGKRTGIAYYRQIANTLIIRIQSGQYSPGERLPSDRDLSEEFGHNRHTVRRALDLLESEDLIVRRQGRGTFVADPLPVRRSKTQISLGLIDITRAMGVRPDAKVLGVTVEHAGDIAPVLDLQQRDCVIHIHRLRSLNDAPIIVEHIYLKHALLPELEKLDLSQSLRNIMRDQYGIAVTHNRIEFESILSTEEVSTLLDIPLGSPLLLEKRITYAAEGMPCEYSEHVYPGDRFSFVFRD